MNWMILPLDAKACRRARCSGPVVRFLKPGGALADSAGVKILAVTQQWSRLSDPYRSGGGHTVRKTDFDTTVDLHKVAQPRANRVTHLPNLLGESTVS